MEGRKSEKGTVHRVPAHEVESKIIGALSAIDPSNGDADSKTLLAGVRRVTIKSGQIVVECSASAGAAPSSPIQIPWSPKPTKAKRGIVLPHDDPTKDQRPIRVERRDTLLRSVATGRFWLSELMAGETTDPGVIAQREGRSKRSVQMMISLTFVAPDIIEAAVNGTLPRGIGLTRLMDLPCLWSEQRRQLGLIA